MENYQKRMLDEHSDLKDRLAKLNAALAKDGFREKVGDYQFKYMINLIRKEVLFIEYGTLVKTISGKKIKEDLSDFRVQVPLLDKIKLSLPNVRYVFIVGNKYGISNQKEISDFYTELFCVETIC